MEAAGVGARAAEEVAEDQVCIEGMGRDERRKVSLMPYRERWNSVCSICRRTTLSRPLINHFHWNFPAPLLARVIAYQTAMGKPADTKYARAKQHICTLRNVNGCILGQARCSTTAPPTNQTQTRQPQVGAPSHS